MVLASAYTKTTSAWAVGSGNGALDTSTVSPSTWYHVFLIKRTDTGVVDVLFSLSPTSPTLPTNYTLSRRIGSIKTNGSSQWTAFTQTGDQFIWAASVTDVNNTALVASRVSKTLTTPTGVSTLALFRYGINFSALTAVIFTALQEADQAPADTPAFGDAVSPVPSVVAGTTYAAGSLQRLTNTSSQIGVRASTTSGNYSIYTYGWVDTRGK